MNLILWRHAEAEDIAPTDLARQLTTRGRKQAQNVAKWLRARLDDDAVILASPAIRTIQTVESLTDQYRVVRELAPGAQRRRRTQRRRLAGRHRADRGDRRPSAHARPGRGATARQQRFKLAAKESGRMVARKPRARRRRAGRVARGHQPRSVVKLTPARLRAGCAHCFTPRRRSRITRPAQASAATTCVRITTLTDLHAGLRTVIQRSRHCHASVTRRYYIGEKKSSTFFDQERHNARSADVLPCRSLRV